MDTFEKARDSYEGRKYLYLFPQPTNNYWAVNYHAINSELNSLLALFSISGKRDGKHKLSEDGNHSEVWFEISDDFYKLATSNHTVREAIERLGVVIVTDYPFFNRRDTWATDWKTSSDLSANYNARWSFFKED